MKLKEWASLYIDYLDSFKKTLVSKNVFDNRIECTYKNKGKVVYAVCEELDDCRDADIIICSHTKKNLEFLIKKWKEFCKNEKLKIIFAETNKNAQWTVIPYLHNKYNDPETLKKGLRSLFNNAI